MAASRPHPSLAAECVAASLAEPTAINQETDAPVFQNERARLPATGADPMTAHVNTRPAKGAASHVRKAAERAIAAESFGTVMSRAMASARAFQDAWAERKAAYDQREAISPWSDYCAAERAAKDAVAFPAILEVQGGPWVGSAGAIVAMVRQNLDGSEQRIDLDPSVRKTQLRTRDAIIEHCAGDPGLAQPILAALEKYRAAQRSAARAVFNSMPAKWRELSKRYDRLASATDRLQTGMMRDVYAALKFPTANPDHSRQKVDLISIAFKDEMPTALYRPDRARRSFEPEEILAVTLGAIARDLATPPSTPRLGTTADLISAWKAQELVVCAEEDKDDLDRLNRCGTTDIFAKSPQAQAAHDAWKAVGEALLSHTPATLADLSQMIDFFAEETQHGRADVELNGNPPWDFLQRMVRAMIAPPPQHSSHLDYIAKLAAEVATKAMAEANNDPVQFSENDSLHLCNLGDALTQAQPTTVAQLYAKAYGLSHVALSYAGFENMPEKAAKSLLDDVLRVCAPRPTGPDAELISCGLEFEKLERSISCERHPTNTEVEAAVAAMDPFVQRAKQLRATTLPGLRAKALMAEHFLPPLDDLESRDLHIQLACGIVNDLLVADIPAEWSHVLTVRPDDKDMAELIREAMNHGHAAAELSCVDYASPALVFEKPNGDEVRITTHGIQTTYGYARRPNLAAAE